MQNFKMQNFNMRISQVQISAAQIFDVQTFKVQNFMILISKASNLKEQDSVFRISESLSRINFEDI
ncbi:hypothetical protein C2G38_2103456 [Gigaspora rosea]|uniref:Uncharacterized protein n=1 Tax=Gigaspora rosea TaxID=44941 RepID=A0A397UWA7_9GLOM|nr:hypothetical protein C2G38_2103456 [Gigaspora rosea]